MQTMHLPAETRTVLENVRWETYVELAEQRRGSVPRMTYDRGTLELMSPGRQHERIGCLLGRMIETYTEIKGIEIQSVASTTFKQKSLKRGFEADEAYYVQHADLVRSKEELDLTIDPPPDLVIEVEITTSAIKKLELFLAMGVPEVWRFDGEHLHIHDLQVSEYGEIGESLAVPGFTTQLAEHWLKKPLEIGETQMIRSFREEVAGG